MRRNRDAIRAMLVGSAGILASACIPIPLMSGYADDSRQNVPAQVPEFVVTGKTTRADVVLALGEPDRYAGDGSWLLYSSGYRTGGLAMVAVGAAPGAVGALGVAEEKMRYRLLIIRFDAIGTVSSAELTEKYCPEWSMVPTIEPGAEPNPCFDLSGDRLVVSDQMAIAAPGEHVVASYPHVVWWQGRDRPPDLTWSSKPVEHGEWAGLTITDGSVVLTPVRDPPPGEGFVYSVDPITEAVRLPFAGIRNVTTCRHNLVPFVTLTLADGSSCSVQVMARADRYIWDYGQTKAAGAVLLERIQAATGAAPPIPPRP